VFSQVLNAGYDAIGFMLDCPPRSKPTPHPSMRLSMCSSMPPGVPTRAALIASLPETLSAAVRQRCLEAASLLCRTARSARSPGAGRRRRDRLALQSGGAIELAGAAWDGNPAHSRIVRIRRQARTRALRAEDSARPGCRRCPSLRDGRPIGISVVMKAASGLGTQNRSGRRGAQHSQRRRGRRAAEQLAKLSPLLLWKKCLPTASLKSSSASRWMNNSPVLVLGRWRVHGNHGGQRQSSAAVVARIDRSGLARLTIAKLFAGYRGKPAADLDALIAAP